MVAAVVAGLAAASAICAVAPASAVTVPTTVDWSKIDLRDVSVPSAALKTSVKVRIIVPQDYSNPPGGSWPVLYLLHGSGGDYRSWTGIGDDLAELEIGYDSPFLIVMPSGGEAGYYSNWVKGPQWETFDTKELPAYLKANFNAGSTAAIGGYSMGGLGALSYAARHPGMYKAVMALSPVADPLGHTWIVTGDLKSAYGKSKQYSLWGNPKKAAGKKVWKAHDPYYLAAKLRGTQLFLYAGNGMSGQYNGRNTECGLGPDGLEKAIGTETTRLAARLKALNIPAIVHTGGAGTHCASYWLDQLRQAWPMLTAALS